MPGFGYTTKHNDPVDVEAEPVKPSYLLQLMFAPRGQFLGVLNWLCPACGKISRAHLGPKHGWHIACRGKACDAQFGLGFTFWQMPRGFKRPIDAGLPIDPMPIGETGFLPRGGRLHRFHPNI